MSPPGDGPGPPAKHRRRGPRLPRTVILLGVASLLGDVGSEMIFPLLPVFLTDVLHASPTFLGLVEGAADAVASLLKLASGYIADRVRRRKGLVASGYMLASAARPLVALATAPWHVLAVRITDRVGKGIRTSPRDALLAESVDQEHSGRAFGFHRAMDHTGAMLGPLVATAMIAVGAPLRTVFAAAAIPGVLSVVAVLLVREQDREPTKSAAAPGSPTPTEASPAAGVALPRRPLPRRFLALLAVLTLFNLGHPSDAFLVLRAREVGVEAEWIPLLWTVFHLAKVVFVSWGGALADRRERAVLLIAGMLVSAVAYVGFALCTTGWQAAAMFVFYAVFVGLAEPTQRAVVKELAPPEARGRAYGLYNALEGLAALPAGLWMGAVWDAQGAGWALGAGAITATLAAAGLGLWRRAGRAG